MSIQVEAVYSDYIPTHATRGSAGFDLRAYLPDGPIDIKPGEVVKVSTGIKVAIPEGTFLMMVGRSGLGCKHGIVLANNVGIVDSDYRDTIYCFLRNEGKDTFRINDMDRIAQGIVCPYYVDAITVVDKIPLSNTRSGGFGSTGVA